jgi:hypothetical protein
MFSVHTEVHALLTTMLLSGIVLLPTVAAAPPAVQDLTDMRTVINAAASRIGDANNPNLGWGLRTGSGGDMGTADLVNNITTSLLRLKFELDTNKVTVFCPSMSEMRS